MLRSVISMQNSDLATLDPAKKQVMRDRGGNAYLGMNVLSLSSAAADFRVSPLSETRCPSTHQAALDSLEVLRHAAEEGIVYYLGRTHIMMKKM